MVILCHLQLKCKAAKNQFLRAGRTKCCFQWSLYLLFDIWFNFSSRVIIICLRSEFSFFNTSTSLFKAEFSSSKNLALMAIWFSFSLLASRDLLAASLFLYLFAQYLLFFSSSGTNCFFLFLMIGWGLSSSSENLLVAGSKSWKEIFLWSIFGISQLNWKWHVQTSESKFKSTFMRRQRKYS